MLVLIRHGESTLNALGTLAGRLDAELTELGRRQARRAGRRLGSVGQLRSSPLRRATQTAELLGVADEMVVDERFVEVDYGILDGTPLDKVPAGLWDRWLSDAHFAPEGGESLVQLESRVGQAMEELFEPDGAACQEEADLVLVSHVSPIKAAVAWTLRTDPLVAWRMRLSNASITRIALGPRGPQLLTFNEVPAS